MTETDFIIVIIISFNRFYIFRATAFRLGPFPYNILMRVYLPSRGS